MMGTIIIFTICLAIAVAVFFAMRAFWLWYFRVNEIVTLLESIDGHLAVMAGPVESNDSPAHPVQAASEPAEVKCKNCGVAQKIDSDSIFCDQCGKSLTV